MKEHSDIIAAKSDELELNYLKIQAAKSEN